MVSLGLYLMGVVGTFNRFTIASLDSGSCSPEGTRLSVQYIELVT